MIPLGSHNDDPISLSLLAAHGSDKFLLRNVLYMFSSIKEQVVLASKLVTAPIINRDADFGAAELLKEKVLSFLFMNV